VQVPVVGICCKVLRYTLLASPPPLASITSADTAGIVTAAEVSLYLRFSSPFIWLPHL
jgi:hypothetical protein